MGVMVDGGYADEQKIHSLWSEVHDLRDRRGELPDSAVLDFQGLYAEWAAITLLAVLLVAYAWVTARIPMPEAGVLAGLMVGMATAHFLVMRRKVWAFYGQFARSRLQEVLAITLKKRPKPDVRAADYAPDDWRKVYALLESVELNDDLIRQQIEGLDGQEVCEWMAGLAKVDVPQSTDGAYSFMYSYASGGTLGQWYHHREVSLQQIAEMSKLAPVA